jgi:hypothetical protein
LDKGALRRGGPHGDQVEGAGLRTPSQRRGTLSLRVKIDQQHPFSLLRQAMGEGHGRSGFADPTLLICHADYFCGHRIFFPYQRRRKKAIIPTRMLPKKTASPTTRPVTISGLAHCRLGYLRIALIPVISHHSQAFQFIPDDQSSLRFHRPVFLLRQLVQGAHFRFKQINYNSCHVQPLLG